MHCSTLWVVYQIENFFDLRKRALQKNIVAPDNSALKLFKKIKLLTIVIKN